LIVAIGIPRDIRQAVVNYARKKGAKAFPMLNITYLRPVETANQANSIVADTKTLMLEALSFTGANRIHLFCAVPSFIALLLGHRLNATASIQCYEYVAPDSYVPTCFFNT
jgi:hypothetical protein